MEYGWFGICKKYEYQNRCSGLGFNGTADQSFNADEKILLGDLSHFNWPTNGGANGAKLKITLNFGRESIPSLQQIKNKTEYFYTLMMVFVYKKQ